MDDKIVQSNVLGRNCGTCQHLGFTDQMVSFMYEAVLYCNSHHKALWGCGWITEETSEVENLLPGNAQCPKWQKSETDAT